MISVERYEKIKRDFGHYASWAVWADEGNKPKDNVSDLNVLDPSVNTDLLNTLKVDYIFLGLNISREIERPFGNFHDPSSSATDYKIRAALKGTRFWGSYMTDIIKGFKEKDSGQVTKHLKVKKDLVRENIRTFRMEIEALGANSPVLIAFGRDAENIARVNLGDEFQVVGIPHYAKYVSPEDYRIEVNSILASLTNPVL